jgi:PhoH-like ATPase
MSVVLDTNILLEDAEAIRSFEDVIIPSSVLEELDGLKNSETNGYRARRAIRMLEELKHDIKFDVKDIYTDIPSDWDANKRDNKIVLCAKENGAKLISNDIALRIKSECLGIDSDGLEMDRSRDEDYFGYRYVKLNQEQQAEFYLGEYDLGQEFYLNEYILLVDEETNQVIDKFKMSVNGIENIKYKTISNKYVGKIKPRNLQQELCFDMLQNKELTVFVVTGGFGVGKDYMMISHALDMIEAGRFDKLIWVRNTIEVKDTKPIGFLKGSMNEKLLPFSMPLADHLGGVDGLDFQIEKGRIELQHLGFMRGRDIKNSIIYCSEAENMTKEHIQLLLGRVGEGSILMLNGDFKQTDDHVFKRNNGLSKIIQSLKGDPLFGFVKLEKVERSATARLADALD